MPSKTHMWVKKSDTTNVASKTTTQPPGVPHPQAGEALSSSTARCECGGITGICGTASGATKWRSHMYTTKHSLWMGHG